MMDCCREYTIVVRSPVGKALGQLTDWHRFELALIGNDWSELTILVDECDIDAALLAGLLENARVEVWAATGGVNWLVGRAPWLVDYARVGSQNRGGVQIEIKAHHATGWLEQRRIAYVKDHVKTFVVDTAAETLIKRTAVQAFGPAAGSYTGPLGAPLRDTSAWVSVSPDAAGGPRLTFEFAHEDLLSLYQDVALLSYARGVPLWFLIEQTDHHGGNPFLTLNVYTGQPGRDLTQLGGGQDAVVLTPDSDSLAEWAIVRNWRRTINRAYVGVSSSDAEGDYRRADAVDLAASLSDNPLGLREGWRNVSKATIDNGGLPSDQVLASEANLLLTEQGYAETVTGTVVSTVGNCYGPDWRWGDRITVAVRGKVYDAVLDRLQITIDEDGVERVAAQLSEGPGIFQSALRAGALRRRVNRLERIGG